MPRLGLLIADPDKISTITIFGGRLKWSRLHKNDKIIINFRVRIRPKLGLGLANIQVKLSSRHFLLVYQDKFR